MRQFQCVPTTYVTENKETIFKFTLKASIMSIGFASFKHIELPISIIIPVTISHFAYTWMTAISPNLISQTTIFHVSCLVVLQEII